MKKILAALILSFGITIAASAQESHNPFNNPDNLFVPQHEFSISAGLVNLSGIRIGKDLTAEGNVVDRNHTTGPFNLQYFYTINETLRVGGQLTYFHYASAYHYENPADSPDGYLDQRATDNVISIMPAVKLNYIRRENMEIYTGLAFGLSYDINKTVRGEKDTQNHSKLRPGLQVSVLGAEFGSQHIRGFMDIGFGEQGVLQFGLRYRL